MSSQHSPNDLSLAVAMKTIAVASMEPITDCELDGDSAKALHDYIVSGNEAIAACRSQATGRIRVLESALRQAVEVIKVWHNMDGTADVWDIYYRNAPEMAPIRAAIAPELCEDCPPVGYPTDKTRCDPCPRAALTGATP